MGAHKLRAPLAGVMVPLITPFRADGELDEDGLQQLVDHLVRAGVQVIIPADAQGEFFSLTLDERARVVRITVEAARGRALVLGHVGASSVRAMRQLAERAMADGADALKITLPYFFRPSADAARQVFREVSAGSPFVIESSDGVPLAFELVDALLADGNLLAAEVWESDISRLDAFCERFGPRVPVIPSGDVATFFLLSRGAPGAIQGIANFAPQVIRTLIDAAAKRDLPTLLEGLGRLRRHRDLFRPDTRQGVPAGITFTKAAAELLGLPAGPVRLPLLPLEPARISALATFLRDEFGLAVATS